MSFDIFVGCFRKGESSSFPPEMIDHAFGASIESEEWPEFELVGGGLLEIDELGDGVSGFSVNRPPGDDPFWLGMLEILENTPSVLYWAGTGAIVGNEATMAELPPDMIETLGEFKVCHTIDEMTKFIQTH